MPAEQVVILAGVVGQDTQGVAAAINQAASNKAPVFLLISSPGGSIIDGASIINAMEAAQVPVYTVCMDLCASMAAIIHQYGTERFMADRAILMFHDAAGQFQGYFPHIKAQFEAVERYFTRFNVYIAKRQGVTLTALEAAEHKNMWVDSEDAMLRKMNDRLVYIEVISQNKALDVKALLSVKPQGRTLPVIGPVAPNFSSENL